MEQSEPNNALGLHFQLETKNQKDNQLGVAESMSYSQFSMSCKTQQPKKTHWNFPWQFSLNKMQKKPTKKNQFLKKKKDLRASREASENQTIAIVDVKQDTAAFPGNSRVLNWIGLGIILGHYYDSLLKNKRNQSNCEEYMNNN